MLAEFSVDGHAGRVHVRRWDPDGAPAAAVFFVHGYAEHGGRYAHVAQAFCERGWTVAAADHVGHGRSDGERAVIWDFEDVVSDLGAAVDAVTAEHPNLPVVMLGHSMGGLITARYAQCRPGRLAGAGFLGAVLGDWQWAREVLALPELPPADSDPSGMSRDAAACERYATDPLVYHGRYKRPLLEAEVIALDAFMDQQSEIDIPLAMFHGDADPFVPNGPTRDAVLGTSSLDVRIKIYAGARHELVNETNRAEVIADIAHWIEGLLRN